MIDKERYAVEVLGSAVGALYSSHYRDDGEILDAAFPGVYPRRGADNRKNPRVAPIAIDIVCFGFGSGGAIARKEGQMKVAILDDFQNVALWMAEWSSVAGRVTSTRRSQTILLEKLNAVQVRYWAVGGIRTRLSGYFGR